MRLWKIEQREKLERRRATRRKIAVVLGSLASYVVLAGAISAILLWVGGWYKR